MSGSVFPAISLIQPSSYATFPDRFSSKIGMEKIDSSRLPNAVLNELWR
jgi:hypothetical protein